VIIAVPSMLHRYQFGAVIPFVLLHAACLLVFIVPFHWQYVALLAATYFLRAFGATAGYHRYFSHRSYKLNRTFQFLMAFLAQTSAQKGVLWWAAHHRYHHRHSDDEKDIHSPVRAGFCWAHVGWILSNEFDTYDKRLIGDFEIYPELCWLNRHHWVPSLLLGTALFAAFGFNAFLWGFVLSTVVLFHTTFSINSLAHVWGHRRYDTGDHSRNNLFLALITLGEGWHNNHHKFMYSCRQGLRWWEIDITYYVLKLLSLFGIATDLRGANEWRGSQS
jgi:stearoyl-CoA desaturase (Delta-9 desaturase)